jgi:hypothetical protein
MKVQHLILTAALASSVTTSVFAANGDTTNQAQPYMPMMQGPQGQMPMDYPQGQPMHPMMMQRMMYMRQQNMQGMNPPENMPMGNMMQRRQQMMDAAAEGSKTAEAYNCPMHKMGEQRMEMIQNKQAMMQAHMKRVESHLSNIETLLKKIVENQ